MAKQENIKMGNMDAVVVGLSALGWTLADDSRANRLLALTGIAAADLRAMAEDPSVLAEVLRFLEGHEPDLVACARQLEIDPMDLVKARMALEGQAT